MLSAENMLHDSFLMVCREIRAYKELVPFEPWLKGMVIGYILRKYKDLIPDTSLVDYNTSEHLKVFNEEIAKIPAANIIRLIQGLPQSQRTVFNLYNLDGLNHKEISQALSISVHSSQTYYQLAVEKLSSEVADDKYTKETIE
jgi:RNA polymerase sigma-70 factor (ECF subfamily)